MSAFSGIVAKIKADGAKVKAAFLKTVNELDTVVLPDAQKYLPAIEQVSEAIVPGSSKLEAIGEAWLEESVAALDQGGAAAEANLANAGLDTAAIAALKALIPQFKSTALATPPVQVAAPAVIPIRS